MSTGCEDVFFLKYLKDKLVLTTLIKTKSKNTSQVE